MFQQSSPGIESEKGVTVQLLFRAFYDSGAGGSIIVESLLVLRFEVSIGEKHRITSRFSHFDKKQQHGSLHSGPCYVVRK
jgi:hypothetical protein